MSHPLHFEEMIFPLVIFEPVYTSLDQVNKKSYEFKKEACRKKGTQERDGIHEAWLTNRFEHADTPDIITQSLYRCLVCHS